MKDVTQKLRQVFANPTHSRTLTVLFMLVIVAAVPLTVFISQKPQELRQRATGPTDDPTLVGWWKFDGSTNDATNNSLNGTLDYTGLSSPPIATFHDSNSTDGFNFDCGGNTQKKIESYSLTTGNPAVTNTTIKIWAIAGANTFGPDGDGLACMYKNIGTLPMGTTIYFWAKGQVMATVWQPNNPGSGGKSYIEDVASGCNGKEQPITSGTRGSAWQTCNNAHPYTEWRLFRLVVDQVGSDEQVYFYSLHHTPTDNHNLGAPELGEANATYYDEIRFGPVIGNFDNTQDTTFDDFYFDCGGNPQKVYVQGYEGSALKIWSGGGDGLACAAKYLPKVPIGNSLYVWAKGYPSPRLYAPNDTEAGYVEDMVTHCTNRDDPLQTNLRRFFYMACDSDGNHHNANNVNHTPYNDWRLFKITSVNNDANQIILYNGPGGEPNGGPSYYDLVQYGPLVADGKIGQAFAFTGSSTIRIPNSSILSSITQNLTISAWVKPDKQFLNVATLVSKHTGVTPGAQYQLGLFTNCTTPYECPANATNKIRFCAESGSAPNNGFGCQVGNTSFPSNAWTLLTVTADGSRIKYYINGVQDVDLPMNGAFVSNTAPLAIGSASYYPYPGFGYTGLVDDVRIYNRALSASEVQLLSLLEPPLTPTPGATNTPTPGPSAMPTNTPTPAPFVPNADIDRNGCIGRHDYEVWRDAYKTGVTRSGTFPNVDGLNGVDLQDFNYWFNAMLSSSTICAGG